jgi:putative ATP-binding cassette transporter
MRSTSDNSAAAPVQPGGSPAKHSFREKIDLLKPFWTGPEKKRARWMLAGIIALTIAEVALSAGIGLGFKIAIDAMAAKNAFGFGLAGAATGAGLLATNFAGNQRQYMTDTLTLDWRGWLTKQFNAAWLKDKAHFRMQQGTKAKHNPDQRVAENIPNVADQTLGLALGLFRSTITLATFAAMLWHLSPLMLGAALVCAAGTSLAAHKIGGPLQKIITGVQAAEAKLRHALVRVRDNAKPIALSNMEKIEKKSLTGDFNAVDAQRRDMFKMQRKFGIFTTLNIQSSSIVPIALAAPKFFFGTATMGGLELMRQAYGQTYTALSWFTQGYPLFANWSTNADQLIDLKKAIDESKAEITQRKEKPAPQPAIKIIRHEASDVRFEELALDKSDGSGGPLIDFGKFNLRPGDRMMLTGPSGCGKSSALCALKEGWVFGGRGAIHLPPDDAVKFVPQDDYFPDLTLRGIVCAPRNAPAFSDADVKAAMREAGLEEFIPQMDDEEKRGEYWKGALSGGQKKKAAIAGVFLQAPRTKLLILDEVTSALDPESEKGLYSKILEKMKHGVVISIVHRMEIAKLHNVVAEVEDGKVSFKREEPARFRPRPEKPRHCRHRARFARCPSYAAPVRAGGS